MKMELREAISRYLGMVSLKNKRLPVRLSYTIAYNLEILEKETNRVDEMKKQLIEQYAQRDENGELVVSEVDGKTLYTLGDNVDAFNKEYDEFLSSVVDLEIRTVSEGLIDKCDDSKYDALSTGEISNLLFMID